MQGKIKHIVILVHPYSTLLNISAPVEAFQTAINHFDQVGRDVGFTYQLHIVSADTNHTVGMSPGVVLTCESSYREITYPVDTLIVAGAPRKNGVANDVLLWLKEQSQTVRRICAMCAGAFILAEAGVLINKRATTHWMLCEEMARTYPQTIVNPEAIFVKDGNVYTSAGVTAGLDLALAFIEEDLGRTFALHVARIMVLFLKRPGNQTQYSAMLESQQTDHQPLNNAIRWICDHLQQPEITVEQLAAQSRMSPRNFARVFVRELHITPIKYVEKLRLEAACRYLTDTRLNMDEIARLCGWKNSNNMNRIFLKTFNTSPSQYRRNFSSSFS
ncbi:MAG: DJ-1/PfpI family protein [Tannerellaceae bacterium]|jgi:transcriptional regulator GlxA family with amidase domain|nr:DJ-1/PfpI family protein [Tannerellaceae bacterium]